MELNECRAQIDALDKQLLDLFVRRMELSAEVAACKRACGLAVCDAAREEERLRAVAAQCPEELRPYAQTLWQTLFALSRRYQETLSETENGGKP